MALRSAGTLSGNICTLGHARTWARLINYYLVFGVINTTYFDGLVWRENSLPFQIVLECTNRCRVMREQKVQCKHMPPCVPWKTGLHSVLESLPNVNYEHVCPNLEPIALPSTLTLANGTDMHDRGRLTTQSSVVDKKYESPDTPGVSTPCLETTRFLDMDICRAFKFDWV